MTLAATLGLLALGLVLGAFGTLVGAGGGFLLVPVLLFLYPEESPQTLTSISLAVVFLSALSGAAAYGRMGRIDYRTGLLFAAATVPAGLAGVFVNYRLDRAGFDLAFGGIMGLVGAWLLVSAKPRPRALVPADTHRRLIDAVGRAWPYGFNAKLGVALSAVVGFLATLLGIGGGTLHVAGMVGLLGIPVHVAAATSQFVLVFTAGAGTAVHLLEGTFVHGWRRTLVLGVGVVVGAQLGALVAGRVKGLLILRLLGLALLGVAGRLLYGAFT